MANPSIAVINFTTTLQDNEVRTAIHAVNRQVDEQFQPIWGCGRTLNAGRWQLGLIDTSRHHQTAKIASSGSVPIVSKPGRHRALLVEDHVVLAEATAELMRLHGLQVRVATTGADALKTAEEFNPVLILCDLTLPDMAGLNVAQALRARRGATDLLIAMFSAMSADDLQREFEGYTKTGGVDLFLSKPLTSETLNGLLSKLEILRPR